jgi:hypothetical protein
MLCPYYREANTLSLITHGFEWTFVESVQLNGLWNNAVLGDAFDILNVTDSRLL